MNTTDALAVNSRDWWNRYFAKQWDADGGRPQTAYFMRQLVDHLPRAEREFLAKSKATILDWGCAFGEGVDVLSKAFGNCTVAGADFAERAVAEAKRCFPQYEFLCTARGELGRKFDVVVVSNCLEHFSDPLSVMRQHLEICTKFYAVLVLHRESPLHASHVSQFREECFPEELNGFTRLAAVAIDGDANAWNGQQLLVVYASPDYVREREKQAPLTDEQQKWDRFYASLPMLQIDDAMQSFGSTLSERIQELLPDGGRVLEAGCGAGWQSLMLARHGKWDVTLMDFSPEALKYAQRSFAQEGLAANFLQQDVFVPAATAEYDLVFNAGVLEHYSFDEQVAFLRGMASHSRKYVIALVPNRMCYWYWLWRMHKSSRGAWPFGKEVPMADLSAAFETAGMKFLGQWFGGSQWTDWFIKDLDGIDNRLQEELLAVHHSSIVPEHQRAYLVAALGCKEEVATVPVCWSKSNESEDFSLDQMTAAMADVAALAIAASQRECDLQRQHREQEQHAEALRQEVEALQSRVASLQLENRCQANAVAERDNKLSRLWTVSEQHREQLEAITRSRSWKVATELQALRRHLLPPGSRRERVARLPWQTVKRLKTPRATSKAVARSVFRRLPLKLQYQIRAAVAALRHGNVPCAVGANYEMRSTDIPGLVSVVLPVYNHAAMLRGAVNSVLAQSYQNFELIIVNDGSTDGVEKVLAEYRGDPRIRILTQTNQKLPKALSNGFEFARGEFWTWTSADNLMGPDQLRQQVEFLRGHADVGMVFADYTAIDAEGRPLTDPSFRPHNRRTPHDPHIHLPHDTRLFGQNADNFLGPCFMYRGWLGRLLGEYDPILGIEDFDYWLRLSLVARIAHLGTDEPLYQYRVHLNSLSGRAEELQIPEHARDLMHYHRQRQEFHAKPWTIYADAATLAWLETIDVQPHRVISWTGAPPVPQDDEKVLLLVEAESLTAVNDAHGFADVPIVAWFPANSYSPDRYRAETQRTADLCVAEDQATVDRLRMLSSNVFLVSRGRALVDLAVHWANGRSFYQATRPALQRLRALPRVLRPESHGLRVLLQADAFTQGGMEQVVIDLAKSLRSESFDVSLLILGEEGFDAARMRQAGFPILRLPESNREEHYSRLLKEQRIDIVNAHYSLFGARLASRERIPFVQTIHNAYVFLPPDQVAAYHENDRFTSAYACVSQSAAHYSHVKLGLPVSKMVLVPNGIELSRMDPSAAKNSRQTIRREFGWGADDFVFLNVGSLQPIKCQATLVNAFVEVVRCFPEAKLALVGRTMIPGYLTRVKEAIARHHLESSVAIVGHREDASRFYWASDAFVLPSLCEGWSLAMAEAIAAGLPIAATTVGSAPDVLPRIGGRLIRPPFGDITNLDFLSLGHYGDHEDPKFVESLSTALKEMCQERSRPSIPEALLRSLDCGEAYKPYGELFLWLAQGGHPAAARPWASGRLAYSQGCSLVGTAAA